MILGVPSYDSMNQTIARLGICQGPETMRITQLLAVLTLNRAARKVKGGWREYTICTSCLI